MGSDKQMYFKSEKLGLDRILHNIQSFCLPGLFLKVLSHRLCLPLPFRALRFFWELWIKCLPTLPAALLVSHLQAEKDDISFLQASGLLWAINILEGTFSGCCQGDGLSGDCGGSVKDWLWKGGYETWPRARTGLWRLLLCLHAFPFLSP